MLDATAFTRPNLSSFCRLDELGLVVVGQRLEPRRAVLDVLAYFDRPGTRTVPPRRSTDAWNTCADQRSDSGT